MPVQWLEDCLRRPLAKGVGGRRQGASIGKGIPDAAVGLNKLLREVAINLASQGADIYIDYVGQALKRRVPHVLKDHGSRDRTVDVSYQIFKQQDSFGRRSIVLPNRAALRRTRSSSRSPERKYVHRIPKRQDRQLPDASVSKDQDELPAPRQRTARAHNHRHRLQNNCRRCSRSRYRAKTKRDASEFSCRSSFTRSTVSPKDEGIGIDENTLVGGEPGKLQTLPGGNHGFDRQTGPS